MPAVAKEIQQAQASMAMEVQMQRVTHLLEDSSPPVPQLSNDVEGIFLGALMEQDRVRVPEAVEGIQCFPTQSSLHRTKRRSSQGHEREYRIALAIVGATRTLIEPWVYISLKHNLVDE